MEWCIFLHSPFFYRSIMGDKGARFKSYTSCTTKYAITTKLSFESQFLIWEKSKEKKNNFGIGIHKRKLFSCTLALWLKNYLLFLLFFFGSFLFLPFLFAKNDCFCLINVIILMELNKDVFGGKKEEEEGIL